MRILSHYFVARFLGLFSTVLAAALALIATVELALNLDDLSSFDASLAERSSEAAADSPGFGLLRSLSLRLVSYYLADLLPIASFVAVFGVLAWAGRAMELVAIQAGGIRLGRIVLPILGAALILSLAAGLLHETLVLRAKQVWAGQERDVSADIDFGRQAFWYHKGRVITNVDEADPETRSLFGVEVFERNRSGRVVRVVRAERVRIARDGTWHVEGARVWRFDPDAPDAPPELVERPSMVLELDALGGDALLGAEPGLLPLPSLARYLEVRTDATPSSRRMLTNRYHDRLSQPWHVLLFAFLALPFALRVDHTGRFARPALEAVAVLGLFFLVRSAGTTLSQNELFPVGLTPWLAIGSFALATGLALRGRSL